ncbi:MAG TPA: DUF4249 domain-containing protein [Chitinophagaceae bacterium]|nr:DUF4249 domain-containing protein [Chitinophagaceae bacterium]
MKTSSSFERSLFFLRATIALIGVLISSCEKVIHLDLNTAEKKYVVEAVVTDRPGTAEVSLSQTKNFDDNNQFVGVSGALITIREEGGSVTTFAETSPGHYEAPNLAGSSGKTYDLNVTIGGRAFTATSTMPLRVDLDTAYTTDELIFTDTRKIVNVVFQDPPGRGNNYRFVQYVNGLKEKQLFVQNDDYTDGRLNITKLYYFADNNSDSTIIKSGDTVRVDMLCIDPNVYKYWYSLSRNTNGDNNQTAPANPVTNMQGGALGYFSAHTLQTRTMKIP